MLRPVAIKTLLAPHGDSVDLVARFRREARLQAGLRHPAIVRLLDFGREPDGLVHMVQEYVDGRTLQALLAAHGRLPPAEATRLLDRLLDGLSAAHGEGIVHRDLKPANIMLVEGRDGPDVRILDFGLAKVRDSMDESQTITATGQILGTPAFMAPEQIEQRAIAPSIDIYAVGAILHQLLTDVDHRAEADPQAVRFNEVQMRGTVNSYHDYFLVSCSYCAAGELRVIPLPERVFQMEGL